MSGYLYKGIDISYAMTGLNNQMLNAFIDTISTDPIIDTIFSTKLSTSYTNNNSGINCFK
jgi:hypothetical protein